MTEREREREREGERERERDGETQTEIRRDTGKETFLLFQAEIQFQKIIKNIYIEIQL